jgi:hypothetical protein
LLFYAVTRFCWCSLTMQICFFWYMIRFLFLKIFHAEYRNIYCERDSRDKQFYDHDSILILKCEQLRLLSTGFWYIRLLPDVSKPCVVNGWIASKNFVLACAGTRRGGSTIDSIVSFSSSEIVCTRRVFYAPRSHVYAFLFACMWYRY